VKPVSGVTCIFFTNLVQLKKCHVPRRNYALTYSFALKDYRDCLVPYGLAVLNVQHSEMVDDKTYNLQTMGHNAVSKDFRWVYLLLFYCI
jgi:hypothetical protein